MYLFVYVHHGFCNKEFSKESNKYLYAQFAFEVRFFNKKSSYSLRSIDKFIFKGNERFKLFNSFWGRDGRIFNISRENKPFEINAA